MPIPSPALVQALRITTAAEFTTRILAAPELAQLAEPGQYAIRAAVLRIGNTLPADPYNAAAVVTGLIESATWADLGLPDYVGEIGQSTREFLAGLVEDAAKAAIAEAVTALQAVIAE